MHVICRAQTVGCRLVIRGTIGAHNRRPGNVMTSAVSCAGLGIGPKVSHFNWIWNLRTF